MNKQGKERVGWAERVALTYIHYPVWWQVGKCCLPQGAQTDALWWPRGVGWGWEGSSRGIYIYISYTYIKSWLLHVVVWQKPSQHGKAIFLPLKDKLAAVRASACNAGHVGSIPGSWRSSPGEGNGDPLQCSCLGNPWTAEEPDRLQSTGLQRVRHYWATITHFQAEAFPGGSDGKESACQFGKRGFHHWVRKIPWRSEWQPTLGFWESHGQRSLAGYSPWGCKDWRTWLKLFSTPACRVVS